MSIQDIIAQGETAYAAATSKVGELSDAVLGLVGADQLLQPAWRITKGGKDVTERFAGRFMDLTLTEKKGFESDEVVIRLDDSDGMLELPPRGDTLTVAIGWQGKPLVNKGDFIVSTVALDGAPDTMTITARSADLRAGITVKRERSWHKTTIGAIVEAIAKANNLKPCISSWLAKRPVDHIDQTSESDVNLLSRLAGQHDAIAAIKCGRLLFIKAGDAESATGKALPTVKIVRASGDRHHFEMDERNAYTAVKAYWHNLDAAHKGEVIVDANTRFERRHGVTKRGKIRKRSHLTKIQTKAVEPCGDNIKVLRHIYATEATAIQGAKAAWEKIQRGMAEFSIALEHGWAEIMPEIPAIVSGFKPAIDSCGWLVEEVQHTISDSGFTTSLKLEMRLEDIQT